MQFDYDHDEMLKSIKRHVLSVSKEAVSIIDGYGLRYSMIAGTALGMVRHKGFIPWDDDIDLGMPRPDYERLIKLIDRDGLPDGLKVRTIFNTPSYDLYWLQFVRYIDGVEAYVDVFPMDGVPKGQFALWCWLKFRNLCLACAYAHNLKGMKKWVLFLIGRVLFGIPVKATVLERKCGYERYLKSCAYEKAKRIAQVCWGPSSIMLRMQQSPADYDRLIRLPFEDAEFAVFESYDAYLTQLFGDYMTPPPVEERIPKHRFDSESGKVKSCQ